MSTVISLSPFAKKYRVLASFRSTPQFLEFLLLGTAPYQIKFKLAIIKMSMNDIGQSQKCCESISSLPKFIHSLQSSHNIVGFLFLHSLFKFTPSKIYNMYPSTSIISVTATIYIISNITSKKDLSRLKQINY